MRTFFLAALSIFVASSSVVAAPVEEARAASPKGGDEDDGVGWFVAVPALMKPAPLNINVPIPGIPCDKKN